MNIITRFAPSPTGLLHIGNVRTALITWLFAFNNNGKFILRLDDTDIQRSKEEYAIAIKEDLKWLGLGWSEEHKQSERLERYEQVKNQLLKLGRLYPCYETPEEIETKRKLLLGRGLPPIYDRASLKLTDQQKLDLEKQGKKPHYRFFIEDKDIHWHDLLKGDINFSGKNLTDPILIREDGSMTYILCSVIDDIDMNITHIIRGEDHITNTAIQCQIFEVLNANIPNFAHLGLMKTKTGEISKRLGGFDIRSLRENYLEPITISSYLARIGSSQPVEAFTSLTKLAENFSLNHYKGKSSANYDNEELTRLNHKVILHSDYQSLKSRFTELGLDIDEDFWLSIRDNINNLGEVKEWQAICQKPITPIIAEDNANWLKEASLLLPKTIWDINTWDVWIQEVKKNVPVQGKTLFMAIRQALTGRDNGPELKKILLLLGYDKVSKRLHGQTT